MKKLMAANWKMFKTPTKAKETALELATRLPQVPEDREVLVFPPFIDIPAVVQAFSGRDSFSVGGQNLHPAEEGAFTGETSAAMLLDAGCAYGLAGHSERRHIFGESDELVGEKNLFGLTAGLNMVLCIGETIEQREAGELIPVLKRQLTAGLKGVAKDISPARLAIAYEPVWAIGTGKVAGPAEILEAHEQVRKELIEILPGSGAELRILYGGSVKPDNCSEILGLDNVDGVLVGGASLQAESFSRIVTA